MTIEYNPFISLEYPAACRLSDNSVSEQKHVKNKAYQNLKSKKKEFLYYLE